MVAGITFTVFFNHEKHEKWKGVLPSQFFASEKQPYILPLTFYKFLCASLSERSS